MASLDLRNFSVLPERGGGGGGGGAFKLTVPKKTGSLDKPAEAFFARFDQDRKFCPVECFRGYLKLSRNVRPVIPSSLPSKSFLSFIRPTNRSLLQRWGVGYEPL